MTDQQSDIGAESHYCAAQVLATRDFAAGRTNTPRDQVLSSELGLVVSHKIRQRDVLDVAFVNGEIPQPAATVVAGIDWHFLYRSHRQWSGPPV